MNVQSLAMLVLAASAVALVPAPAEAGKCQRSHHRHWTKSWAKSWAKSKDLKPGPWCAGGCRSIGYIRFCRDICEGDRRWNPEWLR